MLSTEAQKFLPAEKNLARAKGQNNGWPRLWGADSQGRHLRGGRHGASPPCSHLRGFARGDALRVLVSVPRCRTAVPLPLRARLTMMRRVVRHEAGAAPGARPGSPLAVKMTLRPLSSTEQVMVLAMVLCVAMLPHDTVLVSVPDAGALGGGDGSPAEAYYPADMREGMPMAPGSRKTPLNVEELEKKVDDMVTGLETQV